MDLRLVQTFMFPHRMDCNNSWLDMLTFLLASSSHKELQLDFIHILRKLHHGISDTLEVHLLMLDPGLTLDMLDTQSASSTEDDIFPSRDKCLWQLQSRCRQEQETGFG